MFVFVSHVEEVIGKGMMVMFAKTRWVDVAYDEVDMGDGDAFGCGF